MCEVDEVMNRSVRDCGRCRDPVGAAIKTDGVRFTTRLSSVQSWLRVCARPGLGTERLLSPCQGGWRDWLSRTASSGFLSDSERLGSRSANLADESGRSCPGLSVSLIANDHHRCHISCESDGKDVFGACIGVVFG